MASSRRARSRTVRASGPTVSRLCERGNTPWRLTRPKLGRMPVIPHQLAGTRIEPPVSVPGPPRQSPAAIATAVPLDEPPGECSSAHGLCVSPNAALVPETPAANSFMLILPSTTTPASSSLRTTVAVWSVTRFSNALEPTVVRVPAISNRSAVLARRRFCVALCGGAQRLVLHQGEEHVELRLEPVDAGEIGAGEIERLERAAAQPLSGLGDRGRKCARCRLRLRPQRWPRPRPSER